MLHLDKSALIPLVMPLPELGITLTRVFIRACVICDCPDCEQADQRNRCDMPVYRWHRGIYGINCPQFRNRLFGLRGQTRVWKNNRYTKHRYDCRDGCIGLGTSNDITHLIQPKYPRNLQSVAHDIWRLSICERCRKQGVRYTHGNTLITYIWNQGGDIWEAFEWSDINSVKSNI